MQTKVYPMTLKPGLGALYARQPKKDRACTTAPGARTEPHQSRLAAAIHNNYVSVTTILFTMMQNCS